MYIHVCMYLHTRMYVTSVCVNCQKIIIIVLEMLVRACVCAVKLQISVYFIGLI